ncbi:hypothetical protein ACF1BQ_029875 [Bradyrhizobium sp. RDT10]
MGCPLRVVGTEHPDARSMATSGKDTGIVGYNVQIAYTASFFVARDVTNVSSDRHQLAIMAGPTRAETPIETLNVVADRSYYNGEELFACDRASITVTTR